MKEIDKIIIRKSDFKDIIKSNIRKMFDFTEDLFRDKYDVYVDVNSVISILFRYDNINDKDLINDITYIFEEFIDNCVTSGSKVVFMYTAKPSFVHTSIYPDWCKERYRRVKLKDSNFIISFLTAIKNIESNNTLISIENIGDKHIAQYIFEKTDSTSRDFYLVSKDYVCQSLIYYKKCIIFTGINYIDYRDTNPSLYDNVNVKSFSPAGYDFLYPLLRGDSRNEYKGLDGFGPIKSIRFIKENKIKLFLDGDYPHKDLITKYRPLYDIEKMIEYYKNNKKD